MRNIQQSGKVIGLDRIAIMAALNITHQLLTDRSQNEQNSTKTSKQLSEIQERIETELGYFDEL
jgi:cell division protein ZapA